MELTEREEEALEALWIQTREEGQDAVPANKLDLDRDQPERSQQAVSAADAEADVTRLLEGLEAAGYVSLSDRGYQLTELGDPAAANVVRRHRLAERLLADVLDAWNDASHGKACKFEHLLDRGLDDRICSLLGHPRVCPHGKPIPPGKCCKEMRESASRLVSPLSHLVEGQSGKVAYIYSKKAEQLQKLTDQFVAAADEVESRKQAELMEV